MINITIFTANLLTAIPLCKATNKIHEYSMHIMLCFNFKVKSDKVLKQKCFATVIFSNWPFMSPKRKIRTFMRSVLWRLPLSTNPTKALHSMFQHLAQKNTISYFFLSFFAHSLHFIWGIWGAKEKLIKKVANSV